MNDEIVRRFWSRVKRGSENECWPWIGTRNPKGYGLFWNGSTTTTSQRVAFAIANGSMPDALICHTCDNPCCCNPVHLFAGSDSDNQRDSVAKGRRAHIFGENNNRVILTVDQVIAIRERYAAGEYAVELANEFGVSQPTISAICTGRNWKTASGPIVKRRRGPRDVQGESGPAAKLTEGDVLEIRRLYRRRPNSNVRELAEHFKISVQSIFGIVARRTWKHV
jgi:DNA-binding MarR family transcriptional regulator